MNCEYEMNLNTFGDRLKYARCVLNSYAQEDVAKAAGITRMTVSSWEQKETAKVEATPLHKACRFLGVSLEWMINGTGPIERSKPATSGTVSTPALTWDDMALYASGTKVQAINEQDIPAYIVGGPRTYITRIPHDFLVEFNQGDTIICDPDGSPESGQYLLYTLDGETTIVSYIELPGSRKHISPLTEKASLTQYNPQNVVAIIKGKWYR